MIILHRKFPPNGIAGQFLRKCSNKDNDVEWANLPTGGGREVPTGGTQGQFLKKTGSGDNDYNWDDVPSEIPTGGSGGNILHKTSSGLAWRAAPREVPDTGSAGSILKKSGTGDRDYGWYNLIDTLFPTINVNFGIYSVSRNSTNTSSNTNLQTQIANALSDSVPRGTSLFSMWSDNCNFYLTGDDYNGTRYIILNWYVSNYYIRMDIVSPKHGVVPIEIYNSNKVYVY